MGQELVQALGPVLGGYDGSLNASILPENKYAGGINIAIRGGFARTRPALVAQTISGMPTGTFQGAGVWSLNAGDRFVFVVDGEVYSLEIDTMTLTQIAGGPHLDTSAQCFFCQADRYIVIQDGTSEPVVLQDEAGTPDKFSYAADASYGDAGNDGYLEDTDEDFVADPSSQSIPIGTVMAYVMGRLHVVPKYVPGGTETGRPYVLSGDIVKPGFPEDCLRFKETQYLNGGGAHGVPVEMGFINGMTMMRNSNQGTGSGDLYAFGRNGVCAFAISIPRDQWSDNNIAQGLFVGSGTKSPWSLVAANNDVIFRATDGLRMISYTTSQQWQTGSLFNSPISTEVSRYMSDASYLPYVSSTFFDNNHLTTCEGTGTRYFKGLVHMDVAPTVNLGSPTSGPSYTGVWTGDNFAQVLTSRKDDAVRAFAFAEGPILYLIDPDVDADNASVPIKSRLVTRAYNFENFVDRKKLRYVDLWVSALTRDTTITVYARPYGYPYWISLADKTVQVGESGAAQIRHRLRFGLDETRDSCDPVSGRPLYSAPEFQFAIEWTGHMQLDRALFVAELVGEGPPDPCSETAAVTLAASATAGVELSDFTYEIGS